MSDLVDIFKAIGEPTRLRALRILVEAEAELCACEIIDVLEKPQYTVSKCLGVLVDAGLIEERRDGRMMMYGLAHGAVNDAIFQALEQAALEGEAMSDRARLAERLARRAGGLCISGCA